MAELRGTLDVGRRLYNCDDERFDLYAVLAATARFENYPKTTTGLIQFFHQELPYERARFHDDKRTVLLQYGTLWIHTSQVDFLRMFFYPLYHCDWDAKARALRDSVLRGEVNSTSTKFLQELLQSKTPIVVAGIRLEDVPDDWRDLAAGYIDKGAIDLSKYASVKELEHRVDQLEGLVEPDDSPILGPLTEPPLPCEEREILARTLGLDPEDFTTKQQAMELYSAAN